MENTVSEENTKYQLLQLENKVCVITGAASLRSIGYGTAELFAAHGAKLVILDLAMNDQIANQLTNHIEVQIGKKTEIICIQCDIKNAADCDNAIEKSVAHFGTIDCLVNCAGNFCDFSYRIKKKLPWEFPPARAWATGA